MTLDSLTTDAQTIEPQVAQAFAPPLISTAARATLFPSGDIPTLETQNDKALKIVTVNGSPSYPSKTAALVQEVLNRLETHLDFEVTNISVGELVPFLANTYADPSSPVATALAAIAEADFVIAASPIYKGTYTGLFKHVFDLLPPSALADKPVLLIATGGSERHTLALEHSFRPLFGFFQAETLPLGIYGHDQEFENYVVVSQQLSDRIDRTVARALPFLSAQRREESLHPVI